MSSPPIQHPTGTPVEARLTPEKWRDRVATLALGPVAALAIRLGAAGLTYLLQIVLARSLGAADYGLFSLAWNLVTIVGFLATLGFGQIAVRFLAEYHERQETALARGFIRHAIVATLAGSLVLVALGVMVLTSPHISAGLVTLVAIGLAALPFFALTDLGEGFARSQGWTMRALVPAYIARNGLMIGAVLLLLALGIGSDATVAMALALVATIGAAVLQYAWTMPPLWRVFPSAPLQYARSGWNRAALPTLLADLALLARQNIDLILLAALAPPAMVGIYFAATRIASLIGLVEFAIGASFGHRFARETGDAAFHQARRWMRLAGIGGAMALAMATPLILSLFGEAFAGGFWPALVLLAGAAVRMALGPLDDLLTMRGYPGDVWRANLIGALVTTIVCLLLAGPWQAMGAAIAATLGNLAAGLALALAHRRVARAGDPA